MPTKVFPLRASEDERRAWQAAADRAGLSFNAWARRSLNEAADLDAAVAREDAPRPPGEPWLWKPLAGDLAGKFKPDPRG